MIPRKNVHWWRSWSAALVGVLVTIALVASALPLVETNAWWVRYADFPRLQLTIVLIVLLPVFIALRGRAGALGWIVSTFVMVAVFYHASKLQPYSPLTAQVAAGVEACAPASTVTVMVANVKERNESAARFLELVDKADPDVLLVLETDPWWDRHLAPLGDRYPDREQFIPEGHGDFGMHLFSKLKLVSPQFTFLFDAYSPTIVTGLMLRNGETVEFIGLHPHPPMAPSLPTTLRDAHILSAAMEARSHDAPTILAGDFNAVPWEPVIRRAARIGGLLDPRIGRGFYPTFDANSAIISWPLDQVLYQDGFGLLGFDTLPEFGSDHLPVMARLCHAPAAPLQQRAPDLWADDLSEAQKSIEAARALHPESLR